MLIVDIFSHKCNILDFLIILVRLFFMDKQAFSFTERVFFLERLPYEWLY